MCGRGCLADPTALWRACSHAHRAKRDVQCVSTRQSASSRDPFDRREMGSQLTYKNDMEAFREFTGKITNLTDKRNKIRDEKAGAGGDGDGGGKKAKGKGKK